LIKQEVCDLIDNKDDKKMIQIMNKLKKILLTGLRKIEIRNKWNRCWRGAGSKFRVQIMLLLMKRSKKVKLSLENQTNYVKQIKINTPIHILRICKEFHFSISLFQRAKKGQTYCI
jgi:hypothetical protein